MGKFYGKIGYAVLVETPSGSGIWIEQIKKREYFGDLIKNTRKLQSSSQVNDDINIANEISILADPYANENFHSMRYVEFMGTKWKITDVEVQYPRLILSVGGIYNEQ